MAFFSRGKNKNQDLEGIHDLYNRYVFKHGDNSLYLVEYNLYRDVIVEYYKALMHTILYEGYTFKLPLRLGSLFIIKRKVDVNKLTKHTINWVESVKHSKVIYHLNSHSKNYIYRFKWEKSNSIVTNLYFYKFVASRANKRELAQIIKTKQCDYFE